ncbi:MAG: methyltransferase domain-containing protein [Candidatus Cloacimonetes bacterium]|nr:methyltransferase domain-containing protein [Candidatus Cloacimonadota bacterium]
MKKTKLNLGGFELLEGGGGSPPLEGFTNIDVRNIAGVNIVHDIISLPMFEDESVDEIRVSHAIEHISPDKITEALQEWHRILKPNGILRIYCPDAYKLAQDYVSGKIDCEKFSYQLFGAQSYKEDLHRLAIDRTRLDKIVTDAGFEIIGREPRPNAYPWDLGIQCKKISKNYPY